MTACAVFALVFQMQSPAPSAPPSTPPAPPSAPAPSAPPAAAPAVTPPPAPEAVLELVKKAPAFAAETGRTGFRATPTTPMRIPGVDDKGYFVEFQWTDKAAAAHTGIAVMGHHSVLDVPWMVKGDGEWGLVQVLEDRSIGILMDEVKRTRIAANEVVAIGDIRTITSGEMIFMGVADGAYGDLRCLNIPADCVVGIPGEKLLEKALTSATEKSGYRRKFHAGARVPSAKAKGSPSPFVKSFAYTAVPLAPGETGVRGFCGDSLGRICVSADGAEPPVSGGVCATPCTELRQ